MTNVTLRVVTNAVCAVLFLSQVADRAVGQPKDGVPAPTDVAVTEVGPIETIKDAEHRLGAIDRMFLIEDQWEWDRCKLLLPKLPKVDLQNESLLVIMSWTSTPRTLKAVHSEGDTLVIQVDQAKSPLTDSREYHPPTFLLFRLPAWAGPVRFEINGESQFTVLRGKALEQQCVKLWEEILRIHSGGKPRMSQKVRHYKRLWPDATKDQILETLLSDPWKYRSIDPVPLYTMLFRDLIDIRAKPALPRIFDLIESMGQHDEAGGPACNTIVGIGGPELVEECKRRLDSEYFRSRGSAMGILATLGLPDTREIAREQLADLDGGVSGFALMLLQRIGIGEEDVPAMIHALEQTEQFYLAPPESRPKLRNFTGETAKGIIYAFGELGPAASEALPVLGRFAADPHLPVPGFQPDAKKAIERIRQKSPTP